MFPINYVCLKLPSFITLFFSECFCAFDSFYSICIPITCILINVNKKKIVNYESLNISRRMGGVGFDYRVIQIGQCRLRLATSATFLRGSKLCWPDA